MTKEITVPDGAPKQWLFGLSYLTEALDEKLVSLLLAGVANKVDHPIALWENRKGDIKRIDSVDNLANYPLFCGMLYSEALQQDLCLAEDFCQELAAIGRICDADQLDRAQSLLENGLSKPMQRRCHLGLGVIYFPIKIEGSTVAVVVSGCYRQAGDQKKVLANLAKHSLTHNYITILGAQLSSIKEMNNTAVERLVNKLRDELEVLVEAAEKYRYHQRKELQWEFSRKMNGSLNEIPKIRAGSLKNKTVQVMDLIREFFHAPFVATFCSEKPGDTVLPLFSQVGFDEESISEVHFNWKKASIPLTDDFESDDWVRKQLKSYEYPTAFLRLGLKGSNAQRLEDASFFLPCMLGNKYRGVFIVGQLGRSLDAELGRFLRTLGHVFLARVLSLVALEALAERDKWRDLMTKLLAHQNRTEIQKLMGNTSACAKVMPFQTMETFEKKRAMLIIKQMNRTLDRMKEQADLAVRAPQAAISRLITKGAVKKDYHLLSTLVNNCANQFEAEAERVGVRIAVSRSIDDLPGARIDFDLMQLAFLNILDNAVKYAHARTTITISGSAVGQHRAIAKIVVESLGIGIPQDDLPKIFELGYRSKMAERFRGGGIGLYQAKHFVTLHGGLMWAECEPVTEQGSCPFSHKTSVFVQLPTVFA